MSTDAEDEYRAQVRRALVKKYSIDAANNVTYVDFARIHLELRDAMIVWRFQNGAK